MRLQQGAFAIFNLLELLSESNGAAAAEESSSGLTHGDGELFSNIQRRRLGESEDAHGRSN